MIRSDKHSCCDKPNHYYEDEQGGYYEKCLNCSFKQRRRMGKLDPKLWMAKREFEI